MANKLKHILSGLLTASMFLMFCNMIKKDHIDPLVEHMHVRYNVISNNATEPSSPGGQRPIAPSSDPWGVNKSKKVLHPCWRKSTNEKPQESKGFVFVTLAQDPEYHISQIANAVVVAKSIGATLVLPSLRRSESGKFGEIYDLNKFSTRLGEEVALAMDSQSAEMSSQRAITVKVPNMVSKEFIKSNIEPIFKSTRSLRLSTYFPSTMEHKRMNPSACVAMFETLGLRAELQESIDSMIGTLRSLSHQSKGRFVAVDYRLEAMPGSNECPQKQCFDAQEIALFLKEIGFERETTIYLTLNGWHASAEHLRNIFPNTFTKDAIIPANEKPKFLDPQNPQLKQIVDFYISSAADVYVPTSPTLFSDNVVARRIATGKTQVVVPANRSSSAAEDYIPSYITKKKHWAYSCYCG